MSDLKEEKEEENESVNEYKEGVTLLDIAQGSKLHDEVTQKIINGLIGEAYERHRGRM